MLVNQSDAAQVAAVAAAAASGEQVAECVGRWVWYGHYVDRRSTGGPQKIGNR